MIALISNENKYCGFMMTQNYHIIWWYDRNPLCISCILPAFPAGNAFSECNVNIAKAIFASQAIQLHLMQPEDLQVP